MRKLASLLCLLCALALGGCYSLGGGVKISAKEQRDCAPGTSGCTITVEKGGIIRPYMGYMVDKQVTPSGQVFMNIAVNHSNASLVQTTLPAVVSGTFGYLTGREQASAIMYAAKKGGGIQIYNQGGSGGDAIAQQQTGVDVVQGPSDPDVNIEETHMFPDVPGN